MPALRCTLCSPLQNPDKEWNPLYTMIGRRVANPAETGTNYCCRRTPGSREFHGSCCTRDGSEAYRVASLSKYPPELELYPRV